MSAIAGRIDGAGEPGGAGIVKGMLDRMERRAPHGEWIVRVSGGWLGARRLAVTPDDNEVSTSRPTVVADARIDNRDAIFAACGTPPELGAGANDAEVIAMAYRRWGADCARHLRGDFAFALWDEARGELHAARDPLGARLFYYAWDGAVLRFATEPRALGADPALALEPNDLAIALYVGDTYTENGETLYRDVMALPSGAKLRLARGLHVERYWRPDPFRRLGRMGDEEYAQLLRRALAEAVRRRVRTPGRVAVQLSGGMDSSAVAAETARQRLDEPPLLLHLRYPGLACDEGAHAGAVARQLQLPLVEIDAFARPDLTAPERSRDLPDVVYHPGGFVWSALLEQAVARGARTVATGDGGDLCLGPTENDFASALRAGRARDAFRLATAWSPDGTRRWRRLVRVAAGELLPLGLQRRVQALRGRAAEPLLTRRFRDVVSDRLAQTQRAVAHRSAPDAATARRCQLVEDSGQQLNLAYYDRLAGAHAVQYVHPFLDAELVELLLSLPPEQLHVPRLDKPKPVLRRSLRGVLPPPVLRRARSAEFSSFGTTVAFGRHGAGLRALLRGGRLVERGITTDALVATATDTSEASVQRCMMNLLTMEIWLRSTGR